jgi:hypothetical protein
VERRLERKIMWAEIFREDARLFIPVASDNPWQRALSRVPSVWYSAFFFLPSFLLSNLGEFTGILRI